MKKLLALSLLLLLVFAVSSGANIWGPVSCGDWDDDDDDGGGDDDDHGSDDDGGGHRATVNVKNKIYWVPDNLPTRVDEGFIVSLYWEFFNRLPDKGGFDAKLDKLRSGASRQEIVLDFVMSSENKSLRGNTEHNNYFIGTLYNTLLHREPDQDGLHAWLDRMDDGMSRLEVIKRFLNGEEYRSKHRT